MALNGWILKRKVGTQLYEFKFPRGMVLKAGATTTVSQLKNTTRFDVQFVVDLEFRC